MTIPAEAALRFALGLALGALMGLCYDLLRPLRLRRNAPADLLFVAAALYLWVYHSFGICGGDIRFGGALSLGLGAVLWICTLGKWLRGLIFRTWLVIFRIFAWLLSPFKKNLRKTLFF